MGPADHTEFLGPQIYTLTTGKRIQYTGNNWCFLSTLYKIITPEADNIVWMQVWRLTLTLFIKDINVLEKSCLILDVQNLPDTGFRNKCFHYISILLRRHFSDNSPDACTCRRCCDIVILSAKCLDSQQNVREASYITDWSEKYLMKNLVLISQWKGA